MTEGHYRDQAEEFADWLVNTCDKGRRRRVGDSVRGHCPLPDHPDKHPSFGFNVSMDAFACSCGSGKGSELRERLAFHPRSSRSESHGDGQLVSQFDYRDEQGNLLYQVVRFRPKKFRQRRPDGKGGWNWDLKGVRRVLFRLPELIETVKQGETIFIAEGERDASNLAGLGVAATTNSGGAGKWREEYSEPLRGARVVVVSDNDEIGRKHAMAVGASVHGKADEVRILSLPGLPDKGDVSDWIRAGGTVEELRRLAAEAQIFEPAKAPKTTTLSAPKIITGPELMSLVLPEPNWAVIGLLPQGVSILAGKPKVGKSWMALGLTHAISSGQPALGAFDVVPGDVLYVAMEDTHRRLQDRLRQILSGTPISKRASFVTSWSRLDQGGLEMLAEWVERQEEARLIILDTWARIRPRRIKGSNLYDEDYEAMVPLHELSGTHGIAVIVLHHLRKAEAQDPLDMISGSTGLTGAADQALVLRRGRERSDAVLHVRGRDVDEQELAMKFDFGTGIWTAEGDAEAVRRSKARQEVVDLLRQVGKPMPPKEVAEALDRSPGAVRKLMAQMARDGQLDTTGDGKYQASPSEWMAKNNNNNNNNNNNGNSGNSGNTAPAGDSGNYQSYTVTGVTASSGGEVSSTPQAPCYLCGGRNFWKSKAGAVACEKCHGPADKALVAERIVVSNC